MPSGGPVDTYRFLLGEWQIERAVTDHRSRQAGVLVGTAVVAPVGVEDPHRARYVEVGRLRIGAYEGAARRSLRYLRHEGGAVTVTFDDGRPFVTCDLRSGRCRATHVCGPDRYAVTWCVEACDALVEEWRVEGPAKNYEAIAVLRRVGFGRALGIARAWRGSFACEIRWNVPSTDRLVAFALTAVVVIMIPGPSVLFIVGRALAAGRRTALFSVVGNTLGEYVQVIAVAFGVGAVAERSVALLTTIKLVGGVYLVYLGVRTFLRRKELRAIETEAEDGERRERGALLRGLFVGVTNPKTVVFLAAILPQFVNRANSHVTTQILVLGVVFSAIALVSDSVWALGAHGFRSWFARSPRRLEAVHGAGGLAIAAVGVAVLLTGRKN